MCSGEGKDHNQALHKEKGPSKTWKKSFQSSDYFLPHYNYGLVCPQNPLYGTLTGMYKTILCQKLIQLVLWSLWVLRKDSWPFQQSSGRLWWGPEVTSGNLVDTEGRNPTEYSIGLSENSSAKWRCKKTQGCSLTMNIVGLSPLSMRQNQNGNRFKEILSPSPAPCCPSCMVSLSRFRISLNFG